MSVETALRLAFYGCLVAFAGAFVVVAYFPGLIWPAVTVAMVAGVAAGPISDAIGKRTRG